MNARNISFVSRVWNWTLDRFALKRIWDHVLDRRVAKGAWYFGDGATLFLLFSVLIITGIALAWSYSPSPDTAYGSVRAISEGQPLGWFVRALHYWSAGLMVFMLFFHLFRQILVGGYKSPREATWLIGIGLFAGVMVMSLLGYILRWDERGIYAFRVAMNIFYRIPWIGEQIVYVIQGGRGIGATTLSRVYAMHVLIGPVLLVGLVAYHMYLVVVHSITSPTERRQPVSSGAEQKKVYQRDANSAARGEDFFPDTMAKSGLMAGLIFVFVLGLTVVVGESYLFREANLSQDAQPMEEWWWSWFSALSAYLPPGWTTVVYVGFPMAVLVFLVLLPFIERTPYRGSRNRPLASLFVAACVVALVGLSSLRIQSAWTAYPNSEPPPVPAGITLSPTAEQGRLLFAEFGCNSCHAVDGMGPRVGPDVAALKPALSYQTLEQVIVQPPKNYAMPAYGDRVTDEQLHALVEFVLAIQITRR